MIDTNPNLQNSNSQKKEILRLLQSGHTLTKENAKRLTGAEDYRKRISELRRAGYQILDRKVTGVSRYGHPCTYKEYYMLVEA